MNPPPPPHLLTLPVEIIRTIAIYLLRGDLPQVSARGLLFEDSYVDALRQWRQISPTPSYPCVPSRCSNSRRGARSGQARTCYLCDVGPTRSVLDLLVVCRHLHDVLIADALFWAEALLLNPPNLGTALDRALSVKDARLSFTAHGGACLCVLNTMLKHMDITTRIDLALPSTDQIDHFSPSKLISDELKAGAPALQHIDLRFDWAHAHDDSRKKSIILLPSVMSVRLMNATFAVAGPTVTALFLAAEEAAFRWLRTDIYNILRSCPNLVTLSLQMVLVDVDALPQTEQDTYRPAGTVQLGRLRYLHISDTCREWLLVSSSVTVPASCRVHADVILPMSGSVGYALTDLQSACQTSSTSLGMCEIGSRHHVMALRLRDTGTTNTQWQWPEYMTVSFGDTLSGAMEFRDPNTKGSAGSLTVRNAALSLTSVENPWMHIHNDGVRRQRAVDVFLRGCTSLGLQHVHDLVIDTRHPYTSPDRWDVLLSQVPNVRNIVVYGLPSMSCPHLMDLAQALATCPPTIPGEPEDYPCPLLESIRVPGAKDVAPHAAVSVLNAALGLRRSRFRGHRHIVWAY